MIFKKKNYFILAAAIFFFISAAKISAAEHSIYASPSDLHGQLLIQNFQQPVVMVANDESYLVYEIFITNFQGEPIQLTSLQIRQQNERLPFLALEGKNLANLVNSLDAVTVNKSKLILLPGMTKVIFLWVSFKKLAMIPDHLIHKIYFTSLSKNKYSVATSIVINKKYSPPKISPPMRGDYWVASAAPSNSTHHRGSYIISDNQVYFNERYAIDFIKIGKDGLTYHDNEHNNKNYYCYGQDILSVAKGRVVKIQNGIPENIPHSGTMAVPFSTKVGPGNYIVIDIGQHQYAFYAHVIPGSIKVRVGDAVEKGQVIAKIGNSGHSTEPHLHFQIANAESIMDANSLPYSFDVFYRHDTTVKWIDKFTLQVKLMNDHLQKYENQLMLENWVVKFAD